MSVDRRVCQVVASRWQELGLGSKPSDNLVFMKIQGKLSVNASIIGLVLDDRSRIPVAVVKMPRKPDLALGVEREYAAMTALNMSHSAWEGAGRMPIKGFVENIVGAKVLFQQAAIGHSMVKDMTDESSIRSLYENVLPWLLGFHQHGRKDITLDGEQLERLVSKPVSRFFELVGEFPGVEVSPRLRAYLDGLADAVASKPIALVAQHGDFNAHNIIVNPANAGVAEFNIIDWEDCAPDQLPIHDLSHFFISNSKLVDMKLTAEDAFARHIIEPGWHQQLFAEAVQRYEQAGLISEGLYWKLVPLYLVTMCLRLVDDQRKQESTLGVWVSRANTYVERFPLIKR